MHRRGKLQKIFPSDSICDDQHGGLHYLQPGYAVRVFRWILFGIRIPKQISNHNLRGQRYTENHSDNICHNDVPSAWTGYESSHFPFLAAEKAPYHLRVHLLQESIVAEDGAGGIKRPADRRR